MPSDFHRVPAVQLMRNLGLEPDAWQIEVLEAGHPRLLLNCSRQGGKSTVVAILAWLRPCTSRARRCCFFRAASGSPPNCFASSPTSIAG